MTDSFKPAISGAPLDPEVLRLAVQLSPALIGSFAGSFSVAAWRRNWQLCVKAFSTRQDVGHVEDREFAVEGRTIAMRVYTPHSLVGHHSRPALLWIHGGGFVSGDLYTAGAAARRLANACGCVVVAVRYRLAPEHALEDGLDDCLAAFDWLAGHAERLGLDPARIAVGGDSAGGALAALVAQRRARAKRVRPLAQVLVYPAAILDAAFPRATRGNLLDRKLAELFSWLQGEVDMTGIHRPELSPGRARDVAGLSPTIMVTAGSDPLRRDAVAYARRMGAAGVSVRLLHFPGQFHGFLSFDRVLRGAGLAFDQIGEELRRIFAGAAMPNGITARVSHSPLSATWLWLRPSQRIKETTVVLLMLRDAARRVLGGRQLAGS